MASLKIRDVKKSYGDLQVMHGVDLDVEEGEFVVFVGPSGCGKALDTRCPERKHRTIPSARPTMLQPSLSAGCTRSMESWPTSQTGAIRSKLADLVGGEPHPH